MNKQRIEELAMQLAVKTGQTGVLHREEHIRAALETAVRETREECARVCDSVNNSDNPMTANDCAAAIRKLGEE